MSKFNGYIEGLQNQITNNLYKEPNCIYEILCLYHKLCIHIDRLAIILEVQK